MTGITSHTGFGQVARMRMQVMRNNNRFNNPEFRNQPPARRVQIIKENFVNKQLALTPEQSEKFVPLYHQYQQELMNVQKLKHLNNTAAQANGAEQVNKDLLYDSQLVEIRKRYMDEFLKIMPPEKVSLLLKSEHEFKDVLVKEMSERNTVSPTN